MNPAEQIQGEERSEVTFILFYFQRDGLQVPGIKLPIDE